MISRFTVFILFSLFVLSCQPSEPDTSDRAQKTPELLATDNWTYIEIDSAKAMWGEFDQPEWLRYFGLAAGDLNADSYLDLVSGRSIYLNPGSDMTGRWEKVDLGRNVDANLIYYSDGNEQTYVLGESLPDVLRFPINENGRPGTSEVIARVPPTGHHNGQGYRMADLASDPRPEVIYASQGGLYAMDYGHKPPWKSYLIAVDASDEGFGVGDMDGDGDNDLVAGYRVPGADAEVPTVVRWFENPGSIYEEWDSYVVGYTQEATDRVEVADFNGDGKLDVAVTEEMYPGLEPNASLWTFLQTDTGFVRQQVVQQYSMNNLDAKDMDGDGDVDLLTAEHKGPTLSLQLWLNNGAAGFSKQEIDRGKESHLGTRAYDLDGDGDLDILSIGWDQHKFVHLWRNDAIKK